MPEPSMTARGWLFEWVVAHKISLWGAADLRQFSTPEDEKGRPFPFAVSFAIPMNPHIMAGIQKGPNREYADEYARVNSLINELSVELEKKIKSKGFQSKALAASNRTDTVHIKGEFPHKTAATRAGLGWIGRNCQLITRAFGPWIRLGTVFTDMELSCGPSKERSFCGQCTSCVEACPARALKGNDWHPGVPREEILDVTACDEWKKEHYFQYHNGHNCGICSAVCPYGLKTLEAKP
jgi:epoxyqueuosine reductase